MKKILLFLLSGILCFNIVKAQSGPLVPTDYKIKVKNSVILYEAIRLVNIPVYLNSSRDVNIKYCWYKTKEMFGEKVRTDEQPYRIEEGSYTNGRLTLYRKSNYTFRLFWDYNGEITKIVTYDSKTGVEKSTKTLYNYCWVGYDIVRFEKRNFSRSITNALRTERIENRNEISLCGFEIINNQLDWIQRGMYRETSYDGIFIDAKKWKNMDKREHCANIHQNGSFSSLIETYHGRYGSSRRLEANTYWFNPNDSAGYASFEY